MHRSRIIKVILMATMCLCLSGSANATLTVEVSATDTTFSMTLNGQADVDQLGVLYKDRLVVGFGSSGNWPWDAGPYKWLTPASIDLSQNLPGGLALTGSSADPYWIQAEHSASVESVTFSNHTYSWTVADPSKAPNDLADFGLHLGWNNSGIGGGTPGTEAFGPVIYATVVPEPTTALLFAIGLAGLGMRRRVH